MKTGAPAGDTVGHGQRAGTDVGSGRQVGRAPRFRRSWNAPVLLTIGGSLAVFGALTVGATWTLRATAESEAKGEAGRLGEVTARVALAPFLTPGLLERLPADVARLDAVGVTLLDSVHAVRFKIWSPAGQVLWADDPRLDGQYFTLDEDEQTLFESQGSRVDLSELDKQENELEVAGGSDRLLEVYFGARTTDGQPVLVESYFDDTLVTDRAEELRSRFLPLLIGALALLAMAQVPLSIRLARRLGRSRREREWLLERIISVSDSERRRIAGEVHDGAVQDLIGISYSLAGRANEAPHPLNDALHGLADATRRTVVTLRGLLHSIYPVEVPEGGWASGLDDLVVTLTARGVAVDLDVPPLRLAAIDEMLLLRVAREALRNVASHADASRVVVRLRRRHQRLLLTISDDGSGFDLAARDTNRGDGHLGLQLLNDLAKEVGAVLVIDSSPGTGTSVRLEMDGER